MSKINSLIMPSTIPDEATIRQLLLFSDSVSQFAPSEDSITFDESAPKNLYNHYTPVPLAEDLNVFQKFIKDLTSNRAEYYSGGLSNLSTGLATDIDESTVWQLINKLARKNSLAPQTEKLMGARVLLKLAEIHHNEESEINSALATVDNQMGRVMYDLKKDGKEQIETLVHGVPQSKNANPLQLLNAWFHLFAADKSNQVYPVIATDEDTLGTLYEYASSLISPQQKLLCRISHPPQCFSDSPESFYELLKQFQQNKQAEIKKFQSSIMQAATSSMFDEKSAEELNVAIEDIFASDSQNRHLTFYALPLSLPKLAAKVTKTAIESRGKQYPPVTIAAVVS